MNHQRFDTAGAPRFEPYQLQHLLAASARRDPRHVAIVSGATELTYGELDLQAGRVASVLGEMDVKPGDRIGLFLPKSLHAVASLFGVLKAGGVYVPIDPQAPARRAALIMRDCGIRHLVTTADRLAALSALGEFPALHAVVLDEFTDPSPGVDVVSWSEVQAREPRAESHDGVEGDLAYILYTSGSTGIPKGVMISHRAALQFVNWTQGEFGICPDDIVSNHAPFHFDLSIFDIFTTIKAGARLILVPDMLSTFPIKLTELIREQRITVWYSVPSALILMLTRGKLGTWEVPSLRLVLFAGEVFPIRFLQTLRLATQARLVNLYGPTETNVCTWHEVGDIASRDTPVPIGRATANYDCYALDDSGRPIAPGEIGELYARGPGIMEGYWADPEKTDRVLVQNPLQSARTERVCRTGDLVSIDERGDFIYIGRRDHMVKVRGFRVELGEVEAALYQHAGVREAAVIPVTDPGEAGAGVQLRAYIAADGDVSLTELEQHCIERLPRYMVPSTFELRPSLPKTSTGKVDRPALQSEADPSRAG